MVNETVRKSDVDFADAFTDETGFGVTWALLWLISTTERHVVALSLIGDKQDDAVGAETLKKWVEPQLVAFRRDEDIPMIPWQRVVRILRDRLPAPANMG